MANERLTPNVLWAQRAGKIYLTISLEDCKNPEIKIEKDKLTFVGKGGVEGKEYAITIPFYGDVDPENSKYALLARNIPCVIVKADAGFWPRLLKESGKNHWLKTDFDKWQDEDDSDVDESGDKNFEDMMKQMGGGGGGGGGMPGMGGMGGMGGMPGMGGMGGMGGMPGMGGMGGMGGGMPGMEQMMAGMGGDGNMPNFGNEEEDSDDEDLPDLADVN